MRHIFGHTKTHPNVECSGFRFIKELLLRGILRIATEPELQTFCACRDLK
jgi:hypothetical protein